TPAAAAADAAAAAGSCSYDRLSLAVAPRGGIMTGRMNSGSSSVSGGGGGGSGAPRRDGDGAGLDLNSVLHHNLAALSIDDDPTPGWSQLKPDVAGVPGPAFDADALPMSLMSTSAEVLGAAQGFPVPPSFKLRPYASRSPFPPSAYASSYTANLPPTPGFAASPRAPHPQQLQQVYPLFSAS
ncbi:unnamed protein product, partial [Laminaria digitata]